MTQDLHSLSLRLKVALKILGISQTELAKKINVKPQVIQYLCSSQSQKSRFTCEIAEALDIDFTWLASGKGIAPEKLESKITKNTIPLLTFDQVTSWKINKNEIDKSKIVNWLSMDGEINSDFFAIEINDRAMAPRFDLNTIVIIESLKEKKLEKNSYVLVYLFQENFIIFRQYTEKNNTKFLMSINKKIYKDILLNEKDIILGVCKEARWIF